MNRRSFTLMALGLTLMLASLATACSSDGPKTKVLSYVSSDACRAYETAEACAVDDACAWAAITCPDGAQDCEEGACLGIDPCSSHGSPASCVADTDNACNWIESELLCPPGADCAQGGFCATDGGDDCVCACPLACPAGEDCPPCECECDGSGGGSGGTCTCACPDCPEGEVCPPCACDCTDDGCVDQGTCTCACPECAPGETCPPCDCSCEGSGGGSGGGDVPPPETSTTCACPVCPADEPCPECDCPEPPPDPCVAHQDQDSCLADDANRCQWAAIGAPCQEGEECPSGACYSGGGDDCTCACPSCAPGEPCPPCVCDCSGGGGGSCVPGGGGGDPVPAPPPEPAGI